MAAAVPVANQPGQAPSRARGLAAGNGAVEADKRVVRRRQANRLAAKRRRSSREVVVGEAASAGVVVASLFRPGRIGLS